MMTKQYIVNSYDDLKQIYENEEIIKIFEHINKWNYELSDINILPQYNITWKSIIENIKNNKSFLILTDYDADWVCSWYIHYISLLFLKMKYNSNSIIHIKPSNRYEWYGISKEFFNDQLANQYDCLLTTDIWVSVKFPLNIIKNKFIYIFDHHLPLDSEYLLCDEIIHSWREIENDEQFNNIKKQAKQIWLNFEKFFINNPIINKYK